MEIPECVDSGWACEPIFEATSHQAFARTVGWLSERPLQILLILLTGAVLNFVLRRIVGRLLTRTFMTPDKLESYIPKTVKESVEAGRTVARSKTISSMGQSLVTTFVVLGTATGVLSVLGVSLTAMFASAGIAGVALGFGAQTLVRDVLAGWFIIVEDRYGVGDVIDAGGLASGTVERVTLRSTRLRSIEGTVWHIANGEIIQVGNLSQSWSRAVVDIGVKPTADVDLAYTLLEEVGEEFQNDERWKDFLIGPVTVAGVQSMTPTAITLRLLVETPPAEQFGVERELRRRIIRRFESRGVPLAASAIIDNGP